MDKYKDLLIRSFDEDLSPSEQKELEEALSSSADLRAEKEAIEKMRTMFESTDETFSEGFADRVIGRLNESNKETSLIPLYNAFKYVALAGAAAILILLMNIYFVDGKVNADTIYGLAEYTPDETDNTIFNFDGLE